MFYTVAFSYLSNYFAGFYINLPLGGASAAICLLTKWPTGKLTKRLSFWESLKRLDPVGFFTFAPFCIMLLLALQWGGTKHAWNSATIIGLFCGSVATLCVFIAWEHRCGNNAMMPLNLLRQRIVYSSCIVSTFQMGGVQLFAYYLPVWFQVIKGASPSMSGVYFMGSIGPQMIFAVLSGALSTYFPLSPPLCKSRLTHFSHETRLLYTILHRRQRPLSRWLWTLEHSCHLLQCK